MKRILLTGMSGSGKSTVIGELKARSYKAIDADYGWSESGPDGDWVWIEDRIQHLLSEEECDVLFLCGCASNQGKFYPQFDYVILLSAPIATLIERLRTRTNNPYGKVPEEFAQVLNDVETIEPLLRRGAGHEIDTSAPLDQVVEHILAIVQESDRKSSPRSAAENAWDVLEEQIGTVNAPSDWAAEHDHYLSGTPKRHSVEDI